VNLSDLRTLLDYHYWARDRVLDAAARLTPEQFTRDLRSSFPSVRDTLAHLYSAEWAWYSRWQGHSPTALLPAERFPDVETVRREWSGHEGKMRAFLEGLDEHGVTRVFEYTTLDGQRRTSLFWQMLQHLVNHGSYHRGQLTTMLRQLGAAPPQSTDLVAYYRLRTEKTS
jgi:uncharacterized damage-inducible protein DinB